MKNAGCRRITRSPRRAPTSPRQLLDDPGGCLSRAYDVVINGVELGGGSVRIHKRAMQQAVFEVLGISRREADDKFGFFLRALEYGCPPHGGIAFGFDRLASVADFRALDPRRDGLPEDADPRPVR